MRMATKRKPSTSGMNRLLVMMRRSEKCASQDSELFVDLDIGMKRTGSDGLLWFGAECVG